MKSATLPQATMSGQQTNSYSSTTRSGSTSTSGNYQNGRAIANRLDDAIAQLRNLKHNSGPSTHGAQSQGTSTSSNTMSSTMYASTQSPSNIHHHQEYHMQSPIQDNFAFPTSSVTHKKITVTSSSSGGKSMKSPPPTAKKPAIPPQLRKSQSADMTPKQYSPIQLNSTHETNGSIPKSATVTFDSQGRCTCCPFGYHVDVDFVNFSMESSPTPTFTRSLRRSRLSTDSQTPSPRSTSSSGHNFPNLFIDDVDKTINTVNASTHHYAQSIIPQRSETVKQSAELSNSTPEDRVHTNGQVVRSDSSETVDSIMNYTNSLKKKRRTVTSTELAETMATHLPDNDDNEKVWKGGKEALTISPESLEQIKKHVSMSLQRMQELEEQIKVIPLLQERISRLKVDKKTLAEHLSQKSTVSTMRSIGVGDYDIDEEETRVEKVIQRVVQEAPPKPSREVGVGIYDVNVELLTEAEAYHTIEERVQRIREKEIQNWIQEGERKLQQRRAAMRSFGVGDGDVNAEPEPVKVIEKEVKTVYIEPEKPEQRNVGLQVKPVMRDVCIEFSQHEDKPSTRTCGINVDINDILQETQHSEEMVERTEHGEVQQAGALASGQKNAWQTQKHVIQRKFMEAMTRGTQKDLVAFITGLLRRSVRSVGTTVKPATSDFGMRTSSSGVGGHSVGVGDDSIDVIVKPWTMTRDNFCTVKPTTRTQPTWTDLVLTCDSATNTHAQVADAGVNVQLVPAHVEKQASVKSVLNIQPAHQYTIEKEFVDVKDSSTNTKRRSFSTNAQTEPRPVEPVYKTELSTFGFNIEEEERAMLQILLEPIFKTELETYGHQKNKLYEPIYKTELATSCRPVVEQCHVEAVVKAPLHSQVEISRHFTHSERPRFIGSTHTNHTTRQTTKTTNYVSENIRSYPTVITNTATYKRRQSEESPKNLDELLQSRLEDLLTRCLVDDSAMRSTDNHVYVHCQSLCEVSDSVYKSTTPKCQVIEGPLLEAIFVISPFSSASDMSWSSYDDESCLSSESGDLVESESAAGTSFDPVLCDDYRKAAVCRVSCPDYHLNETDTFLTLRNAKSQELYADVQELYTGAQEKTYSSQLKTAVSPQYTQTIYIKNKPTESAENSNTTTTTTKVTRSSKQAGSNNGADVNLLKKEISKDYVDGLLGIADSQTKETRQIVTTSNAHIRPETLREEKTEISEDGAVSEVVREVQSAPGMHAERTVRVTRQDGGDGSYAETVESQVSSNQETSTTTSRVTMDDDSLLGANFQKHKDEMMRLLGGQKKALSPISIDVTPPRSGSGGSSSVTTTTTKKYSNLSADSPLVHSPANTISPGGVIIEREGQAQRKYEEELRRKNQPSPLASVSRHVTSTTGGDGDFKEVVEEKESADGLSKEVIVERSFTSSSSSGGGNRFGGKFPDFSDYFGRSSRSEPPSGRSERMMSYGASTYSPTSTAEFERNKTEIAGDPLRARYNIDDLASPRIKNDSTVTTTTTTVVTSSSHGDVHDNDDALRSIMKKDSKESSSNRSITFAEEAIVAEVIDGDEIPVHHEGGETEESDEDSEEESFEEGTYEAKQGDVSYHCDAENLSQQSGLVKAKSQEEIDIDVELQAACSIVQQHLEANEENPAPKVNSALSVIQQDWFKVASGPKANVKEVDGYMACFEDFSTDLLEHIINMTDGNGNTVLHYAVSHCNFPIVRLLVESGVSDVNLQNKAGYTPIMLASLAEVQSPNDRQAIKLLLSKGNVNLSASQPQDSSSLDFKDGQTALMLAVSHGRHEMVELLLEAGADVNLQDEDGSTALMCATEHGHTDIVKTLLNHQEIDISLKDNDGSTALEIALENSQKDIGMLLYAKDQAMKANSTTSIKKRATRIPSSGRSSKSSRTTVVTRRRH